MKDKREIFWSKVLQFNQQEILSDIKKKYDWKFKLNSE